MKAAIHAHINPSQAGGVESNTVSLLKKLNEFHSNSFKVLAHHKHVEDFKPLIDIPASIIPWNSDPIGSSERASGKNNSTLRDPEENLRFKNNDELLRSHGINAIHFPDPLFYPSRIPFLYEPWDLQHRHFPEFFEPAEIAWRDKFYFQGCSESKLIITATQWIKQDIIKHFGIRSEKIAVIPRCSLLFQECPSREQRTLLLHSSNAPEKFIFYPAMTFAHKNHLRLFKALAQLRDRGIVFHLVCTGRKHKPFWPSVENELHRLNLTQQVQFLGAVSGEMLATLYTEAQFMVFPSLFEGLGLPLLEAMYHGLPILAADSSCIPEVVGDAALLFDGSDTNSIQQALYEANEYPDRLESLARLGADNLKRFNWDQALETFISCYRYVAGERLTPLESTLVLNAVTN